MDIKINFKLVSGIKGFLSPEIDLDALNLYAPVSYWEAAPSEKRKICNGCGAKEGLKVPDTLLSGNHKEIERWRKNNSGKFNNLQ